MIRIKYLILILLCITFIPKVKAIVSPTKEFYINDYANILSEETEQYILNKSVQLNNVDGTQIVVVTVPNLEGMPLESYATQLFRNFGIGDKEKDNGLLLLLALEERLFRVEVGYGLEGILPDGKTGRFQDEYIIPYLKDDNWNEGIINGYDAFYKEIVTLNNLDLEYAEPIDGSTEGTIDTDLPIFIVFILFYFIPFSSIIFGTIIRRTRKKTKKKYICIYMIFWIITTIFIYFLIVDFLFLMIINLFLFLMTCLGITNVGSGFIGGSSRGSSSGGGFSGGGSSGGGGSSRGY